MDWKAKRVLVTGGAGLVGSHLVDALVERGAVVVILDNLDKATHPNGKPAWVNSKAKFILGDMRKRSDLEEALSSVEYVFHQAAFGGFTPQLSTYIDSNAMGTALMFEVIRDLKIPIKKIVAASSQAVYGEGDYRAPDGSVQHPNYLRSIEQLNAARWEVECEKTGQPMKPVPTAEGRPLHTETIYGISKLAEEKLIIGLGRKLEIPTVALRYAVTYGPRQSIFNPYTGVVSIFSTQLLNGVRPTVYEDGEQTRDFLYVADNVNANLLVMEDSRADMQVFNVGRGVAISVNQLVRVLSKKYEVALEPLHTGEFRPGDVRHFVHDSRKLEELGFKAATSIEEGLDLYVKWIRSQGKIAEYFSRTRESLLTSGIVHAPKA